ncbi:MAG TPA: Calx-beta domain-containing protein [Pyrinomonadaceae bacterium]|nr:Calx-beta domain-containing protein [Pyrinomonadaceae bacterium]
MIKHKKSPARLLLASLLVGLILTSALQTSGAKDDRQAKPANHTPEPTGKIAFASERDGNYEIYTINPDGGGVARLTTNTASDREPTWSPDGTKLAFVSNRDGNAEIYVMTATGDASGFNLPTRLTNNTADDLNPVWSPDGTKIAFVSGRSGNDEIFVVNASGGSPVNLTNNPFDDFDPSWSPDGAKLAFVSNRDANEEIYTMDATGASPSNISHDAAPDRHPSWGGTRIAFQSARDGNDEIYIMNAADGGALARLTTNAALDAEPWLSADGARIVFQSTRNGSGGATFDLFSMNASGGNLTRLTLTGEDNDLEASIQKQPPSVAATTGAVVQFLAGQSADGSLTVSEGATTIAVQVTRTGDTSGAVVVDYAATSGSASERSDFQTTIGTLTFAAGETQKSFTISIVDDGIAETDETVNLTLGNPTGATLGALGNSKLTIIDNDTATATVNPIDTPEVFVRQHYLDFLNREPETTGFNSWVNLLRNCPAGDTRCDRIEVSMAFFRSAEYQIKGYLVIRFYLASFGRFPTYREFIRDTQRINGATPAEVFANQAAYANEFAARPDFKEIYDALSNEAYVNKLLQTAGITLSNRAQLVSDLNTGAKTRAQVLRAIVESVELFAKEYNRGFVASQYYGYLRRDIDVEGFNGWLNYLNTHPNDYRTMVGGFINSNEYRVRFGAQ